MEIRYAEIQIGDLDEIAASYVETFNSPPWNDKWTFASARKRLQQMINTEDSYGLCAYQEDSLCGVVLGGMEEFYTGNVFNIKEFWVRNGMRGTGIGTAIYQELERRVKDKGARQITLLTIRGDQTEHFYHNQGMATLDDFVFMRKRI